MSGGALYLAWRYIRYNLLKSAVLVICLSMTFFLPLAVSLMMDRFETQWRSRAQATPLVIGAKGSRFDLALQTLYFTGSELEPIPFAEHKKARDSGYALSIPMAFGYTAQDFPIAGVAPEYYEFRGLRLAAGDMPLLLGECVLGAEVADSLGLVPGDKLLSDAENVFDIGGAYPLEMTVTGVLARNHTPDDRAVFTSLRSFWVIAGYGHGHQDLAQADESVILREEGSKITANAALVEFTRITEENINTFHFHEEEADLPLSSIIAIPKDERSATLLKGRYLGREARAQILEPAQVIDDMLAIVFRVRRLFDANFTVVMLSTLLFLGLILVLSARLRAREMATMVHIGCSRRTIFLLYFYELAILLVISLLIAGGLAWLTAAYAETLILYFIGSGG